jgi:hypothetical protein
VDRQDLPQPEQVKALLPRFRRTQSFSVRVFSSISCRYTRYPGQSKILVNSRSTLYAGRNDSLHYSTM